MSTNFEPMSEDALKAWSYASETHMADKLAKTALHHLARAKAAEEARDAAEEAEKRSWLERDALIVERDEAYRQAGAVEAELCAVARDGARKRRDELRAELAEARRERDEALAKVADLESMRAGVAYFACWPDGMLEALGATDVSGVADVMERVMALVGAERERDRLLRSEADVCAILGAAPDELLSDAAKRTVRAVESVYPGPQVLREILGAAEGQGVIPAARAVVAEVDRLRKQVGEVQRLAGVCETMGAKAIGDARRSERVAVTVEHVRDASIAMDRRKTWNAADPAASWAELLADLRVALAGCGADELAQIRHALNVPLDETALQSVVWLKNTLAEVHSDLAHHNSMQYEVARAAGLPDATAATWVDVVAKVTALSAEAEPPQVFRIKSKVTIGHDYDGSVYASVAVDEITDPGFLALSGRQFSRLGLVVCDD